MRRSLVLPVSALLATTALLLWLAVSLVGIVVAALIVHLQINERARRAGRVKTHAFLVVTPTRILLWA